MGTELRACETPKQGHVGQPDACMSRGDIEKWVERQLRKSVRVKVTTSHSKPKTPAARSESENIDQSDMSNIAKSPSSNLSLPSSLLFSSLRALVQLAWLLLSQLLPVWAR